MVQTRTYESELFSTKKKVESSNLFSPSVDVGCVNVTKAVKAIQFYNGQNIPIVGLGMWQMENSAELENALDLAIQMGYRHFDTATRYKNEASLGKVLQKWIQSGKLKREDFFITTKLPWNAMRADLVEQFMKLSLEDLQLTYVDLYLIHWPIGLQYISRHELFPMRDGKILYDKSTNLEGIWRAMEEQVKAGRTKSIGVSNFNEKQIGRIMKIAEIPPVNNQVEVHAYFQQKSLRAACSKHNIRISAYGSLGSPGRNRIQLPGMTMVVPELMADPVIVQLANKYKKAPGQILIRFLTQQGIAVFPKSSKAGRLQQNINIFDFSLSEVDMKRIEGLDKGEKGRSFNGFDNMEEHPECPWAPVSQHN